MIYVERRGGEAPTSVRIASVNIQTGRIYKRGAILNFHKNAEKFEPKASLYVSMKVTIIHRPLNGKRITNYSLVSCQQRQDHQNRGNSSKTMTLQVFHFSNKDNDVDLSVDAQRLNNTITSQNEHTQVEKVLKSLELKL